MTDEIEDIVNQYGNSRPVFTLSLNSDCTRVEAQLLNQYAPDYKYDDPVARVASSNYTENFNVNSGTYGINKNHIMIETYNDIRTNVLKFIEENSGKKNGKATKLYRWARYEMPTDRATKTVIVELFKYMCSFTAFPGSMKAYGNTDLCKRHVKNVILLLEAMMEKNSGQR